MEVSMKLKTVNTLKRSVSAVSAMAMAVSVLPAVNTYAVTGTTHYDLDGYSIDYTVTNEWIGHQTVAVKLTNTSDEPILNWALGYDAHGDIENIWNGNVSSKDDNGYIIKNAGYNYEIAPGSSVSYGYTLSGFDLSVPDSFEVLSKRVDKTNGYVVNFSKVSDWRDGFQGEIVILNTSSEPLEAWTVGFDSSFEINSLWGGRIISHENSHYEIAAESWTNPIAPDSQVTIGFIGVSNGDASISNKALSTVVTGRNADDTEKPELSVSASGAYIDGTVELIWDSTVNNGVYEVFYSTDNVEYASIGTTKKKSFTFTPDSEVNGDVYFKIKQTAKDGRIAESPVVVVNIPAPVIKITPELSVTAEYDIETGYINAAWETNVSDGSFKVVVLLGDEEISSCGIKDTNSFSFKPEKSGEYLIKVTQTTETGMTATRSVSVNAVVSENTEPDPEINWEDETDTDNDGLPDVYELNYFNTDPNKADTDGDELPDGYEVMNLGTDPAKADSDENGISDADEDADEDKLTNKEEYILGTNPIEKDTDQDGLSDYDEAKIHGTDPIKYDTDGDSISDGDEIALGLDPLNPATDGTPDSEHTFVQHIESDSENMQAINTEDNPYRLSVDVVAAGNAINNFYSDESGFSAYVWNDTILGIIPQFHYPDDLKVEGLTLKFEVNDSYLQNSDMAYASQSEELIGIKRFNVFKYFDDIGMMLPIETHHDTASNLVYADVDEIGTYCLVDMEKWFKKLGVEFDNSDVHTMNTMAGIGAKPDTTLLGYEDDHNNDENKKYDEYIDVVIVPYTNVGYLDYVKNELTSTCDKIFKEAEDRNAAVRIHFISWTGDVFPNNNNGTNYAESIEDAAAIINRITYIDISLYQNTQYNLTKAIRGIGNYATPDYYEKSRHYCFFVDAGCLPACNATNGMLTTLKDNGLDVSFVYSRGNTNSSNYSSLSTEGSVYEMTIDDDGVEFDAFVISHIFAAKKTKRIIKSNDFEYLPDDFGEISMTSDQDYDDDGLNDVDEIDFSLLNKFFSNFIYSSSKISLPSLYDYFVLKNNNTIPINLFRFSISIESVQKLSILPVYSNPVSKDTDLDGFDDLYEFEHLAKIEQNIRVSDKTVIQDNLLDDSYAINDNLKPSIEHYDTLYPGQFDFDYYANEYKSDDNSIVRMILTYNRSSTAKNAKYKIKPVHSSDYIICLNADNIDFTTRFHVKDGWKEKRVDLITIEGSSGQSCDLNKVKENLLLQDNDLQYQYNENNKYIYMVLQLVEGHEYTISIENLPISENNYYNLSVEQNNWIYAPNGCITEIPLISSMLGEYQYSVYIPDNVIKDVYSYYTDGSDFIEGKNDKEFNYICKGFSAELLAHDYNHTYLENSINFNNIISTGITYEGVGSGLVIAIFKLEGKVFTYLSIIPSVVGLFATNNSAKNSDLLYDYETSLTDSLYYGRGNIVYTYSLRYDSNFPKTYYTWHKWNVHHYINKYEFLFNSSNCKIRYRQIIHKNSNFLQHNIPDQEGKYWVAIIGK